MWFYMWDWISRGFITIHIDTFSVSPSWLFIFDPVIPFFCNHPDYCNAHYVGANGASIALLQQVQKSRLLTGTRKFKHIYFTVYFRIHIQFLSNTIKAVNGLALMHIAELLHPTHIADLSGQLHLIVPKTRLNIRDLPPLHNSEKNCCCMLGLLNVQFFKISFLAFQTA